MKHKHNYIILTAKTPLKIDVNKTYISCTGKVGVSIVCSICGKEKKHLSNKICKIYANTESKKLYEDMALSIEDFIPSQKK